MYLDRLAAWANQGRTGAGPKAIFYFEAFDEAWKQGDDKWGLFNASRQARYAIQALNPASTSWVWEPGTYSAADAAYFVPPVIGSAVAEARYIAYSDAAPGASESRPAAGSLRWDAWDGTTASYPEVSGGSAPGDGTKSIAIAPTPKSWGWGLFLRSASDTPVNLSGFATGTLNFSVRSFYPGKIEVGILTDSADRITQEAYLQIGLGEHGYCNTGAWCQVSIPVKDFVAANPGLDLSLVLHRFVIADRFVNTLKAQGTSGLPAIDIDAIYWAK
jgi:hypothetical protein